MAERRNVDRGASGSNTFLAFVLGAVVLAIAVMGYLMLNDEQSPDVEVNVPDVSGPSSSGGGDAPSGSGGGDQPPASGGGQ